MNLNEKQVFYELIVKMEEAQCKASARARRSPNETPSFQDGLNHGEAQGIQRMLTLLCHQLNKINVSRDQLFRDLNYQEYDLTKKMH